MLMKSLKTHANSRIHLHQLIKHTLSNANVSTYSCMNAHVHAVLLMHLITVSKLQVTS